MQPDDANKFVSLFEKSDVNNGVMSGDIAKQIFERARLPNEVLGRIWNLSDTQQRGALDATEFIIAMHLLTSFKSGALRGIPQVLPPGLYEAASRRGSGRPSFGSRPEVPPVPAIPKQFTGPQRTASPMSPRQFGGQVSAQTTGGDWLITPQEKSHFDGIFETVDTTRAGIISGDQAVAFFMKAQLSEEVLAQIWDLADIDADGQLTRDEFAVAMYLVRLQRSGKEALPQVVPPALIPPSMRRQGPVPVAAPTPAPAPAAAPAPLPRSAADDLFGLDSPPPPQKQMPMSTGGSNAAFQAPASPTRSAPNNFKPFVPTSTFGQTLQPQTTGASAGTPVRSPPPPSDDLLGEADPEESSKLTQETTELANLSNQIGSLSKELHNVQEKRTVTEQGITQSSAHKRDFETRLAQARTMYEQEVANFKALEERLKTSKTETTKLQSEYALIEGSRQDLATQYQQISTALASDQQENASLKEKIRQANREVAQLKPALDKARSEARQQKGLVAINKKQLATVEGERDKIQGEIDTIAKETPPPTEDSPAPAPAEVSSPAASTASQNTNPFFRRTTTGGSSDRALSPDSTGDQQKAFDNIFNQTFNAPAAAAPPTSFRAESPLATSKSPATSNVPTPSASPAPGPLPGAFPITDPPPPAQSRQFTPNFLGFNDNQSVTSSTIVSPPGSRYGGPEASGVATPSQSAISEPLAPSATGSSDYSRAQPSTVEATPVRSPFDEIPPAATATEPTSASAEGQETAKDLTFDELFGSKAHKRSESQKENDFEEAFASMKPTHTGNQSNGGFGASGSEFPPIQEVHHDEEESSDDEGPLGFDDNFTPVSPGIKKDAQPDSIDASQLAAFPSPGTSVPTPLPPADAQPSPPKYEAATDGEAGPAPEFNGLLPERADPTALGDAPHSVVSATGAPVIANEPQREVPAAAPKSNAPDFDAAFAGLNLAPATEADDDDDEPDNKAPDFDFSFDSPSNYHGGTSSNDASHAAGSSEFFSFDSTAPSAPAAAPGTANGSNPAANNHDWDALFAPLDGAKPAAEENAAPSDPKPPGWALQTDSGEDDQFLQRLTGMGFPREASLSALEKFDYNLDKVSL